MRSIIHSAFRILVIFCLFSWIYSGIMGQNVPRKVLWEQFSTAACTSCDLWNPQIISWDSTHPDNVVQLNYHLDGPETDPFYSQYHLAADHRKTLYGVSNAPHTVIDGNYYNGHTGVFLANLDTNMAGRTPQSPKFQIVLNSEWSTNGDSLLVSGVIKALDSLNGNYRLFVAVREDIIGFDNSPVSTGAKVFHNVVREMLPSENGLPLSGTWNIGDSLTYFLGWEAGDLFNPGNLSVVAFVQDVTTQEVQQAEEVFVPRPFSISLESLLPQNQEVLGNNQTGSGSALFSNTASSMKNYRFEMDLSELPPGWTASMTIQGVVYSQSALLAYPGGSDIPVVVNFSTGANNNERGVVKLVVYPNDAFQSYKVTQSFTAYSSIDNLIVDTDARGGEAFKEALDWNSFQHLEMTESDLNHMNHMGFNKGNIDHIFYTTGEKSNGVMNDQPADLLISYLESNGDLFLSSQDLGWYLYEGTGQTQLESRDLYRTYLGSDFIWDGNDDELPIVMLNSDYPFRSLGNIDLDNLGYNLYSDRIAVNQATENSIGISSYGNNPDSISGIRNSKVLNDFSQWQTVYLPYMFEALSSSQYRADFVQKAISYFDSPYVGFFEKHSAIEVHVFPNPVINQLFFELSMDCYSIKIVNSLGQTVLSRESSLSFRNGDLGLEKLENGIYFALFEGKNGEMATKKIIKSSHD